jgi:hypothetical protein
VAKLADVTAFTAALDVTQPVVSHVVVDATAATEQAVRQVRAALGQ